MDHRTNKYRPTRPPVSPPFRAASLRRVSIVVNGVMVVDVDDRRGGLSRLIRRGPILVNPCHDKRAEPCHEHAADDRHGDFPSGVRPFVRGIALGIWPSCCRCCCHRCYFVSINRSSKRRGTISTQPIEAKASGCVRYSIVLMVCRRSKKKPESRKR